MFDTFVKKAEYLVWASGIPVGDEVIPFSRDRAPGLKGSS